MAQSFHAISTSLGEAERQKDGKNWTAKDYKNHQERGYKIDEKRSDLNTVFVSAGGQNERDLVNGFLLEKMQKLNTEKVQAVRDWNTAHAAEIGQPKLDKNGNPRLNKKGEPMLVHKKSVDKRELFPVGKFAGKGKRQLPYDTFMAAIRVGNLKGKEGTARYRSSVLQQYAIGLGNAQEWRSEPVRNYFLKGVYSDDPTVRQNARDRLNDVYFKPELERFQKENPSLHVVQAVVHYDETDPHMQITVMPWVDGKENGGLGSTSYGGAIKTDHNGMTIATWYQSEHDKLRELIQTADTGLVNRGTTDAVKMPLDAERPGSHQSTRVDVHARMQADLDKQAEWLKQQTTQSEDSAIRTLKMLKPDHMVPKARLNGGTPAKISTSEGEQQHRAQPLAWLLEVAQRAYQAAEQAMMRWTELYADQKAKAEEAESKAELAQANLAKTQFVRDAEMEVAQRDAYEEGRLAGRAEFNGELSEDYLRGMDSDPTKSENYDEIMTDKAAADDGGYADWVKNNEADTTQGRNKRNQRTKQENAETHKPDWDKLARAPIAHDKDGNAVIGGGTPKQTPKRDDGPDIG